MGCLSWNQHILASGCREGVVVLHDVRVAQHQVARMEGHQQEVPATSHHQNMILVMM